MENKNADIKNAMDKKAIPDDELRTQVNKIEQNPAIKREEKINSSVDGLNQAATPNNELEPGISSTNESDES